MGNVNDVLKGLLDNIEESGLKNHAIVRAIVNGDINQITEKRDWVEWIKGSLSVHSQEFPTLNAIWECAQEENFNVLYIHTKGVSRNNPFIEDWVELLKYFNITKWEDRIKELDTNDSTGVNWGGNPDDINEHPSTWGYGKAPLHYSGNFWWSKSEHISKLPNPIAWAPDVDLPRWRMMCEMWLCQIPNGKYHCAHSSGIDHYLTRYPKELYQ
jgi:hypothetical protein